MEIYHVINRGVDGRDIFMDSQDYARFVHNLYEFNDTSPAMPFDRATSDVRRTTSDMREKIVDIHGCVLMKNHYHMILSEKIENGLTLFLRKLSGYARYFNDRHRRKGTLLQGRTKKVLISNHPHFLYVLHYVHLNPLDYLVGAQGWRERDKGDIKNVTKALTYLDTYRWSSYLDYCGQRNFPSVLTTEMWGEEGYVDSLKEYLSGRAENDLELSLEM